MTTKNQILFLFCTDFHWVNVESIVLISSQSVPLSCLNFHTRKSNKSIWKASKRGFWGLFSISIVKISLKLKINDFGTKKQKDN